MSRYTVSRSRPKPRPNTNNGTLQIYRGRSDAKSTTKPIWIWQVETDFSITGSFGQSVGKRDFYPRNFSQPSYSFYGQTHNENEFGDLCEFIRKGQLESIFSGQQGSTPILMRIKLPKGPAQGRLNRNLKGRRPPIWLEGYVQSIARRHERFIHAPEYQFDFIVVNTLVGPFRDEVVESRRNRMLTTWDQYLRVKGGGIIQDPDKELDEDSDRSNRTEGSGTTNVPHKNPSWVEPVGPIDWLEDPDS